MAKLAQHEIIMITGGSPGIVATTARMAISQGYDVAIDYARGADSAARLTVDVRAKGDARSSCGVTWARPATGQL